MGTVTYDKDLATRLARRAVTEAAPHELAQFDITAAAFHAAPEERRVGGAVHRGDPLALGLETAAAMLGTVALAASVQVLTHLGQQAADHVTDTARRGLLRRFGRRRRTEGAEPPRALESRDPLTAEQLAELRRVARDTALRRQVPEAEARAIADGIVAELATATAGEAAGRAPDGPAPEPEGPSEDAS
ncbi:hypothetical protein [Streptomyces abyssomicinicus]|uniref:hypothetical protein n=1 Tax=Streptomyces abyssomicinicus TaxID=574929 RepID=UPI00124FD5BA|nr:hypothetical protein [Streptomyces abyssomicinicus]